MEDRPKTVAFTTKEGGPWIPFDKGRHETVHAIMFEDGRIWDAYNGWRPFETTQDYMDIIKRK